MVKQTKMGMQKRGTMQYVQMMATLARAIEHEDLLLAGELNVKTSLI